ncbi:MAG TPA: S8 family peptidase [Actinomycetota bacterium]
MKRTLFVVVLAGVVAATLVPASMASSVVPRVSPAVDRAGEVTSMIGVVPKRPAAVPGEVVVTYRPGAASTRGTSLASRMGAHVVASVPGMGMQTFRLPSGASVDAAIRRLQQMPGVASADPNFVLYPMGITPPDDTYFSEQWALLNSGQAHFLSDPPPATSSGTAGADVDAETAWATTTGAATSVIAVIDTGVDVTHPDLEHQLVDPSDWANFAGGDPTDPTTPPGESPHGTHVSGIIAAEHDNAIGISGVCPSCKIMPIRFGLTLSSELEAIDWAIDHGADVINASYGGAPWNKSERNAIKKAGQAGVLFVAAAGNQAADNDVATFDGGAMLSPSFPASYELDTILSVAASNHKDEYGYDTGGAGCGNTRAACSFTSFGRTSVDVAAPGTDILSTVVPGEGTQGTSQEYDTWNGTSMAAPMVAGIAGLVKAEHPGYTPVKIKNAIMNSVEKPAGLKRYVRITSCNPCSLTTGLFTRTNGRVDAAAALTASTANATKKDDGTIAGAKPISVTKNGSIAWPNDPNDVYKKSLKKGKLYEIVIKTKMKSLDFMLWGPGTVDLWQLSAGCLGGPGSCTFAGSQAVKAHKTVHLGYRPPQGGMYFFQLASFYQTASAGYTLTVKLA